MYSQYILLACQLSLSCPSFPKRPSMQPKWESSIPFRLFPIGNFNPYLGASASFTITPLYNINGQPSTLSRGWDTKYINLTEAQLLYRLLECLSSSQYSHIEEVFTSYKMEEWAYRLAQLEWKKTKEKYSKARKITEAESCSQSRISQNYNP
ncbi:hypothetical protein L218DRAFT_945973 [Marasmius fiardii PR-910]|nr:hypothetical protein L218DRAFT_945973 [Marasmius fiardii PR-910]